MGKLNKLYRAFVDFRKITFSDSDLKRDRKTLKLLDKEKEYFQAIKIDCTIEEDWVKEIESKMEYITKAVKEERQFIETTGEVVPIEKVKRVSKDSVKHLAKHSNLITKIPENEEDLIPEKLYMVEKISDYTVYENRFLYMLLCYMRDFIDLRLTKINEAISTYKSDFKMKKTIESKSRVVYFETSFFEDRKDNPYPLINEKTKDILLRISSFNHDIQSLLKTDLMLQVAEAPMIKPPITKTNVLKMNNNFKNAVALYEYLISYDKVGYSLQEVKIDLHPFVEPMSDEIIELVTLTSFLSYKYGNDLESLLKDEYEEEERQKKIEENKRTSEQIKALKKKIKESGMSYDEYMLMLEKYNRQLEKDSADLIVARNEIKELNQEIKSLENENEILNTTIDELNDEIDDLNQKYIDDMAKKEKEHQKKMAELEEDYEEEIDEIIASHEEELVSVTKAHQNEVDKLEKGFELQFAELKEKYDYYILKLNEKIDNLHNENSELIKNLRENTKYLEAENVRNEIEKKKLINDCNKLINDTNSNANEQIMAAQHMMNEAIEEARYANAKLNAIKKMHGMLTDEDDFTSKERFTELEQQRKAFNKLYKEEWKKTKNKIKREIFELNNPEIKSELDVVLESESLSLEHQKEIYEEYNIGNPIIDEEEILDEKIIEDLPVFEPVLEDVSIDNEEIEDDDLLDENEDIEDVDDLDEDELFESKGFNFRDIKFRSLKEKLKNMPLPLAGIYNNIKNDFMKYDGVTSKLGKSYDCIYIGRRIIAKLGVTPTKVKVYLAVDPNKYNVGQYPHKDLSEKKTHANTPYFAVIKSPLSIKRIKTVYREMMEEKGVEINDNYKETDFIMELVLEE